MIQFQAGRSLQFAGAASGATTRGRDDVDAHRNPHPDALIHLAHRCTANRLCTRKHTSVIDRSLAGWVLVAATNTRRRRGHRGSTRRGRGHLLEQIEERHRGPRDAAAFTRLWVHKEAVLKCTGHGLMLSPRSFSIDFSCNPPSVIVGSAHFATPICLATLDAPAGYVAALAVAGTQEFTVEVCRQGRATKDSCAFDIDLPAECRGESSGPGRTIDGNLMASPGNREPHRPIGHSGPLCAESQS
jgi:hypothetical protein